MISVLLRLFLLLLICGSLHATNVKLISDPFEAASMRSDLFDELKPGEDFYFSVYSVKPNESAFYFFAKMYLAARRGVNVNILLDHQKTKIPQVYLDVLAHAGVKVFIYNPSYLGISPTYNHRLHEKFAVYGDRASIITDANLSDMYYGIERSLDNKTPHLPYSRHLYVEGAATAAKIKSHIDDQIKSGIVKRHVPSSLSDSKEVVEAREHLLRVVADPTLQTAFSKDWKARPSFDVDLQLMKDIPGGKKNKLNGAIPQLITDMKAAKHSILLESAYVVPTPELMEAIQIARANKVPVTIVTSHEHGIDNPMVAAAWPLYKDKLIALGVEIFETDNVTPLIEDSERPARVHAKAAVIDNITHIASANLDGRSQNINAEAGARALGQAFADHSRGEILGDVKRLNMLRISDHNGAKLISYPARRAKSCMAAIVNRFMSRVLPGQL